MTNTVGRWFAQAALVATFALICVAFVPAPATVGDEPPTPAAAEPLAERKPAQVLARVEGRELTDEDVRLALLMQLPAEDVRRNSEVVRRQALFTLVQRELTAEALGEKFLPNETEIDLEIERRRKAFTAVERSWDDELRRENVSEAAVRKLLAWRIGWSRYLDETLTEAQLEKYFDRFRWRFDGSRRRVAHLLLKSEDDPEERARVRVEAEALHAKVASGELTFDDAVRERSQAESAADGGSLGWLAADGPMPEAFLRATFALDAGQVSGPIETPFGFHLIRCEEIERGTKTYQDVRDQVAAVAREDLFRWFVERRAKSATIEFVGNETRAEFERSLVPSLLGAASR